MTPLFYSKHSFDFRSSQNCLFFLSLSFEVEGTLNKNTVQCQHFFLLNIEINKIVCFYFCLCQFVISTAGQTPV